MARNSSVKEVMKDEGKIDSRTAPGSPAIGDGELRNYGGIKHPDNSLDGNNQLESSDDIHFSAA